MVGWCETQGESSGAGMTLQMFGGGGRVGAFNEKGSFRNAGVAAANVAASCGAGVGCGSKGELDLNCCHCGNEERLNVES